MIALGSLIALILSASARGDSYGFTIQRAELFRAESGKGYLLDADIDYRFSEPTIDALRNGVSLGLVLHIIIKQESGWLWEKALLDETIPYYIAYHSLSKLYQIKYENNGPPRNFVSFNTLLETMGSIRGLPLSPATPLRQGERYRASLSVCLDIESLPLPLRPMAYITPAWHLSSQQYKWSFAN